MRIGLYFGSFNPVHVGHLIIAESILGLAKLDQVWLVVSPQNPFKEKKSLANAYDRLHLVELATADNPNLFPADVEFGLPQPNYTIDTLIELAHRHPACEFALLMGEDNLAGLHKWKRHEEIRANHEIYVYPRLGYHPLSITDGRIYRVAAPILEISATSIRNKLANGLSARYFLTEPVLAYIETSGLYQAAQ